MVGCGVSKNKKKWVGVWVVAALVMMDPWVGGGGFVGWGGDGDEVMVFLRWNLRQGGREEREGCRSGAGYMIFFNGKCEEIQQ